MSELTYKSATELAAMIRAGTVSSTEVISAHIARIEAVNPKLNAVVQLMAESARARAAEADAALAGGENWGPLHGIPFTVKDSVEMQGVISTAGTHPRTRGEHGFISTVTTISIGPSPHARGTLCGR